MSDPFSFVKRAFCRVANQNSVTVSMRKGERFIKDIYEALRSGPKWQNTMLFIGYGAAPLALQALP